MVGVYQELVKEFGHILTASEIEYLLSNLC